MVAGLGSLTSSPPLTYKLRSKVSMTSLGGGWAVAEEEGAMSAVAEEEVGRLPEVAGRLPEEMVGWLPVKIAGRLLEEMVGRLPVEVAMQRESRLAGEQQQETKLQQQS